MSSKGFDLQSCTTERQRSMYFRRQTSRNETFLCQLLYAKFSHGRESGIRPNSKQSNLLRFANWRSVKICENIPAGREQCLCRGTLHWISGSFMFAQTFTQLWNFSFNEGIKRLDAVNAKRKCSRPINKAYELHLAVGLSACLTSTLWSVHVNLFWPELAFTSLKAQYRCLSYLVQGKGAVICTAWIQSSDGSVSYIVLVSVFGILVGYY